MRQRPLHGMLWNIHVLYLGFGFASVCVVSGGNAHACMHHNCILSLLVFPQNALMVAIVVATATAAAQQIAADAWCVRCVSLLYLLSLFLSICDCKIVC